MTVVDHLPWRYDDWKKHPDKVVPQDGHILVSIHGTSDGVKFDQKKLCDSDIPVECEQTGARPSGTDWSLRLLMVVSPYVDFGPCTVPFSLDTLQALRAHWHLPYSYVPSLGAGPDISMAFSPLLGDKDWKGFVHNFNGSRTTIMHNGPTRRTFGVCLVDEDDIARVMGRLQPAQSFGSNPLLLPTILLSMSVHDFRSMQIEVFMECLELEETMGFDDEKHEVAFDQMASFTRIPQRLNVLSSRLASSQYYCSCFLQVLDCLQDQLQNLPDGHCTKISAELQEQMIYFRVCSEDIGFISKRGNTLVQSMTQTLHANLQQRDNQLNHRYGADMRTITAITLIFLPGTFVATFFSTTFWDFSPDNNSAKVTYWVYLYFVATIGLTLLVLIVWLRFGALERLTMKMVRSARQIPLLGRLIREKKVDDEESGKKGD